MRSEGYGIWFVCVCVCVCVHSYSGTTDYGAAYEQYKRLQNNEIWKLKGDFPETTAFRRYGMKTSK